MKHCFTKKIRLIAIALNLSSPDILAHYNIKKAIFDLFCPPRSNPNDLGNMSCKNSRQNPVFYAQWVEKLIFVHYLISIEIIWNTQIRMRVKVDHRQITEAQALGPDIFIDAKQGIIVILDNMNIKFGLRFHDSRIKQNKKTLSVD